MNLGDVARITGEEPGRLRGWQDLGLLGTGDDLSAEDLERARLVAFADRQGVSPEELARICAERGDMLDAFVRWAMRPERLGWCSRPAAYSC